MVLLKCRILLPSSARSSLHFVRTHDLWHTIYLIRRIYAFRIVPTSAS